MIELAKVIHIRVYPVSNSYVNAKSANLVLLGYGGLSREDIDLGIQLLAKVWQER